MDGVEESAKKARIEEVSSAAVENEKEPAIVKQEPSAAPETVASVPSPTSNGSNPAVPTSQPTKSTSPAAKDATPAPNRSDEPTTATDAVSANGKEPSLTVAEEPAASAAVSVKGEPTGSDVEMKDDTAEKVKEALATAAGSEENGKETGA